MTVVHTIWALVIDGWIVIGSLFLLQETFKGCIWLYDRLADRKGRRTPQRSPEPPSPYYPPPGFALLPPDPVETLGEEIVREFYDWRKENAA